VAVLPADDTHAGEDWVVRSFVAQYYVEASGSVAATEEIVVDFGGLERHGIFRDIPVRYEYDSGRDRLITISSVGVSDGAQPMPFELTSSGANLRIKIGDPDVLVSGEQRYLIRYFAHGGLNSFPDHDELYWNVTGNEWPVGIENASASMSLASPGIENVTCYQGPVGSTTPCDSSSDAQSAEFFTTQALAEGSGLTIVVGIANGVVSVPPPVLVDRSDGPLDAVGFRAVPLALAVTGLVLAAGAVLRLWWIEGRDRWFGDMYHISDNAKSRTKPPLARETIVVEYQPPEIGRRERRLRPAEVGLLVDEEADTLDVSATIVDLAVRKYLVIKELPKDGILGIFRGQDYQLEMLGEAAGSVDQLLPYERRLMDALFEAGTTAKLSELKNKFHEDLILVKRDLYEEATKELKLFARNPDTVRTVHRAAGVVVAVAGAGAAFLFGAVLSAAIVALPIIIGGLLLLSLAHLMPRRTAQGRVMYRRCLGFRRYMVTAETERQKFAEQKNIFEQYLPYAIVYGCVKKWAEAFEGLGDAAVSPAWYVGTGAFVPVHFAESVRDFSSSISSVMASTPGGSGGSGFGGGGFSGGGAGGGGGGSW